MRAMPTEPSPRYQLTAERRREVCQCNLSVALDNRRSDTSFVCKGLQVAITRPYLDVFPSQSGNDILQLVARQRHAQRAQLRLRQRPAASCPTELLLPTSGAR